MLYHHSVKKMAKATIFLYDQFTRYQQGCGALSVILQGIK